MQSINTSYSRIIKKLDTPSTAGLIAYVKLIKALTPANERLVRTYHPDLSQHELVSVYEYPGAAKIWVVVPLTGNLVLLPQEVVGRKLCVMPTIHPPREGMELADPLPDTVVDPYKYASEDLRMKVMEIFPNTLGVGLLSHGVLSILFCTNAEVDEALAGPRPETIGGMLCHFDVLEIERSYFDSLEFKRLQKWLNHSV